ncbi:calcium/sodium antiporter [Candidatus Falkowbacteria bacterium]|jgi:cation:H+ antiporter|nr:calcium/sodium antiporter [Candidatus Falkowbacteria bacterium]
MEILFWAVIFIVSIAVLIKASDFFTDSAEKIGIAFGIPAFIVGVTIVALGTSLPELVSSIIATVGGNTEIVAGNVIGSNIANILLVLALAAIFGKKLKIYFELIHVDLPLLIGSTFLLALTIIDGKFTWQEGVICLALLVVYITYTVYSQEKKPDEQIKKELSDVKKKRKIELKTWIILAVSCFFIYLGAKYTIDSVVKISEILNVAKELIAVSAIALGTSLPELMVSISAARKGKAEMAVGNVLGSNIFNALMVMGIPSLISTLIIPTSILMFSLPVLIIVTLLYFFITQDKEITRWEGWMLLIFYVFFIGKLFSLV